MSKTPPALGGDLNKSGKYISLEAALESGCDFDKLSVGLQQQLLNPLNYRQRYIRYAVHHNRGYYDLPGWLATVTTEKKYFEDFVTIGLESLQLYPYAHIQRVVYYTGQTPLLYYQSMMAELLKKEKSYDTLPNFTAVDILNLLGIGRNQYLNITKEVRSKLWWKVNRGFVKKHLPTQLLPSVVLEPYWKMTPVVTNFEDAKKCCDTDAEIGAMKELIAQTTKPQTSIISSLTRTVSFGSFRLEGKREHLYACEMPFNEVNELHRKGLVVASFEVDEQECVTVPPLERFVMNRTSDDPQEALLYRLLTTIDDRTNLETLAGLLHINTNEVCDSVGVYIRLGLAKRKSEPIPAQIRDEEFRVHDTWVWLLSQTTNEGDGGSAGKNATGSATPDAEINEDGESVDLGNSHPQRRAALLFDASLTGYLMMTNLSTDPAFKQHAVTLFEAGKLTNEALGPFLDKLDSCTFDDNMFFGEEAEKYSDSVRGLRHLLHVLREHTIPGAVNSVDMLKIEAINELDATTRYTVMCRNYGCFFVVSPVSPPPLLDIMLEGVYGASASLVPSPWLLLYCYSELGRGPNCALLRRGERLPVIPPVLKPREIKKAKRATIRLYSIRGEAETHEFPVFTSLIVMNDLLVHRSLFAVLQPGCEEGQTCHKQVGLPFAASDESLRLLILDAVGLISADAEEDAKPSSEAPTPASPPDAASPHTEEGEDRASAEHSVESDDKPCTPTDTKSEAPAEEKYLWSELPAVSGTPRGKLQGINDIIEYHHRVVALLHAEDSLGYCSYQLITSANGAAGHHAHRTVESFALSDVGFGVPLVSHKLCKAVAHEIPKVCGDIDRMDRHSLNMRKLAEKLGAFMDTYCASTHKQREEASLRSAGANVALTQSRSAGFTQLQPPCCASLAVPYPVQPLQFDGEQLQELSLESSDATKLLHKMLNNE